MILPRGTLVIATGVSLALHLGLGVLFVPNETEIEIAGTTPVDMMIVGTAFVDALASGKIADEANEESLEPGEDTSEYLKSTETTELVPTVPDDMQSINEAGSEPVAIETLDRAVVDTPVSELAAVAEIPVPVTRPKITPNQKTSVVAPKQAEAKNAPKKVKVAAKPKAPEPARGNGGKQTINSRKGAWQGTETTKNNTRSGNAAVSNYPGKVASKLRRALRYPKAARKNRLKGQTVVSFTVTANGGVHSVGVARSSGSSILDSAALEAVHRAAPFPAIPVGAGRSSWRFSVPLAFKR